MKVSETLSDEQKRTLVALVDQIIPPSSNGEMPGAAEAGCADQLQGEANLLWLREGLISITEMSHDRFGREFASLTGPEREHLVAAWRRSFVRASIRLANQVVEFYYQHETVLEAIGLPSRPPFPEGYVVEDGDLTLLEPVFERGNIYRD
jgi:hypothetical protein